MIIAIPADEKKTDSGVCPSFGRTPCFLYYNTETKESHFMDNGAADSPGGAGIQAAQELVDGGAQAVLTPRCGENAGQVLKAAEIAVYKTVPGSVQHNVEEFLAGRLTELTAFHPGYHGL